jgi:hypothetical protein
MVFINQELYRANTVTFLSDSLKSRLRISLLNIHGKPLYNNNQLSDFSLVTNSDKSTAFEKTIMQHTPILNTEK